MKRYIFIIALCLKLETYCVGDDLLSGYANIFSTINISSLTVNVNPSIEANQIKDEYEYLVFVFMNGVNDLGILNFSISDINEMEMVGSTDKVAVVVEHNRIEKTRSGLKFGSGANTYFIKKDPNNSRDIISQIISYTPDGDMGSARHFAISAHKVIKRFKPQKLIIIVWNHGNGYFGISHDDVSGNSMSVKDLGYALSQIKKAYGKKIDIFAMDACLMQMAEVISEIKDYARFVVASEELVPGAGYPYDDILNDINFSSSVDDAAKKIVDAFYAAYSSNKISPFGRYFDKSITLSVIDTSSYSQFISLLNRWVSRAIKSSDFKIITSTEIKENIFFFLEGENSETFEIGPYMSSETEGVMTRSADLVDYLKTALSKMTDDVLKNYTENLINFITKKLVLYHKACDYQNSKGFSYKDRTYGIAIYLPKLRYNSSKYEGLKFSKDSLWNEFLKGDLSDEFININLDDRTLLQNDLNNFSNVSSTYTDSNINGTKIKIETDKSIIDKFSNNLDLKTYTSISVGKNNITDNKNNQGKRNSSATNIYSISYTHKKTVIPKEENLISVKKSDFEINSQKESFDNKQKEEKSFSNLFIEKPKNIFLATLAKIGYGTDKLKGLVFDDKEKKKEVFLLFDKFENEISNNLSVEFSRQLIINTNLQNEFLKIDKNRASKIIAYANSIIEIDEILSKDYSENDVNILSSYLSSTLDRSRQICELKICVPPENLIDMMRKNQKYDQAKINFTQYAIRSWEYVFSNEAFIFNWAQARNVVVSSTSWLNMSVKERNVALEYIVKESLIMGTSTHNQILFTPNILRQVEKRQELSRAV
ncbi:MAG: clostripain-related cysteine peptidase, partial [Elusimicrobiales bacterium]|nr:clostripain-related cysteine peptidase [Elusimicrobiales bacterium]